MGIRKQRRMKYYGWKCVCAQCYSACGHKVHLCYSACSQRSRSEILCNQRPNFHKMMVKIMAIDVAVAMEHTGVTAPCSYCMGWEQSVPVMCWGHQCPACCTCAHKHYHDYAMIVWKLLIICSTSAPCSMEEKTCTKRTSALNRMEVSSSDHI